MIKMRLKDYLIFFYNMVENQFQMKIKILYTYNGVEHFNQVLGNFLPEKGIHH